LRHPRDATVGRLRDGRLALYQRDGVVCHTTVNYLKVPSGHNT
jgi:hypothetical protein